MRRINRYETSGLVENQTEQGSRGKVLKNLLHIKKPRDMWLVETREYSRCLDEMSEQFDDIHRFTASDICSIHKNWLGKIYKWAGQYRRVNTSKSGFPFAATGEIPKLMTDFERGPLREHTPCTVKSAEGIALSLAVVHVELLLIHPFREGNGRIARLLSILMGLQAGLPSLNFGSVKGREEEKYFSAVRSGLDRNYMPMTEVFRRIIERTLKSVGRK